MQLSIFRLTNSTENATRFCGLAAETGFEVARSRFARATINQCVTAGLLAPFLSRIF
jgi:hypothetical protein